MDITHFAILHLFSTTKWDSGHFWRA